MSRKSKLHARLNPPPKVSLFGDPLDRLLNGGFTDELRKQLPKHTFEVKKEALPVLIPAEHPLRVVFYNNHCKCGHKERVFGYFCRKTTEATASGNVTSYKPVEPNGPPQEIAFQDQTVPFCEKCIPNGLPVRE